MTLTMTKHNEANEIADRVWTDSLCCEMVPPSPLPLESAPADWTVSLSPTMPQDVNPRIRRCRLVRWLIARVRLAATWRLAPRIHSDVGRPVHEGGDSRPTKDLAGRMRQRFVDRQTDFISAPNDQVYVVADREDVTPVHTGATAPHAVARRAVRQQRQSSPRRSERSRAAWAGSVF